MDRETLWESIYERFDPLVPPARPEWRIPRTKRQLFEVHRQLNIKFNRRTKFLIAGTIGAGKSTELRRLAEDRRERAFVVSFDINGHLADIGSEVGALARLESWEMLVFIGLAISRACREAFPGRWNTSLLDQLGAAWGEFLPAQESPELDIGRLLSTVAIAFSPADGGASLAVAKGAAGILDWTVSVGRRRKNSTDQDTRVRRIAAIVAALIEHAEALSGRPLLFLLDGLDRLSTVDELEQAEALLVRSRLLQQLPCQMVVLAPVILRFDQAFALAEGFEKEILANEPVLDMQHPADPACPGPGIPFFEEVFAARVADLVDDPARLIEPDQLRRLARWSGGRVRDFIEFIRAAAGHAYSGGYDHIPEDIVDVVLDKRRRLLESGLFADDVEALRSVRDRPFAAPKRSAAVLRMLITARLLPYPNDSAWLYPHPLILSYLDRA